MLFGNISVKNLGSKYLIPLLGVWQKAEDIDFDSLPDQFVLKCTHDSQSIVICRDKAELNKKEAVRHLGDALKIDYSMLGRNGLIMELSHVLWQKNY